MQSFSLFGSGLPQLGALTRPVAADMDQDGITDMGVYTPDGSGATGTESSEWFWFVSNFAAPHRVRLPYSVPRAASLRRPRWARPVCQIRQ